MNLLRVLIKSSALLLISFLCFTQTYAQSGSGEVKGLVSDVQGPLPGARVTVYQGGIVKFQVKTDAEGKYSIKPVPSGEYEIEASFIGIGEKKEEFYMALDAVKTINILIGGEEGKDVKQIGELTVTADPILQDEAGREIVGKEQINNIGSRNTSDFVDLSSSTLSSGKKGDASSVSIDGGRDENTVYILDGVILRGARNVNMPINSLASVEVMSGGLSAKYGDATGGVISMTTLGISRDPHGGIYWERGIDGYGHNQVSLNVSGPFWSRYDSSVSAKRPIAGYFIAADYINNKDGNPNYHRNIAVNDEKIAELEANPLTYSATGGQAFQKSVDFITRDDWTSYKYRPNARSQSGQIVTKLDFMPSIRTNITVGFQLNYNDYFGWSKSNSYVNPLGNAKNVNYTGRTYLRFTQRVANSDENARVSNLYFTGQLAYQRDFLGSQNSDHKEDFFKYGYIGRFEENRTPIYTLSTDDSSGVTATRMISQDGTSGVKWDRGEANPILANYTDFVFDNAQPNNVFDVLNYGGLINGSSAGGSSNLGVASVGGRPTTFYESRADQTSFNFETGFTLKPGKGRTDHNLEIGLIYEQRVDRIYNLGASGLWTNMRLNANKHIQNLDLANPIFRVNGEDYTLDQYLNGDIGVSALDTINYNRLYVEDEQSFFDKNLRRKLGLAVDGTDYIQIDALDPSVFSLDMFSADDLLNQGNRFVSYNGYSYLGELTRGRVSFNDYFLQKDENGNYTRAIDAFRPIYFAGYIMDKFQYKDIKFNLGLRIDRYDANNKVLRDPYSLYGVRTVGEVGSRFATFDDVGIPSNIGNDYVVYVNDNQSENPIISGYRSGDRWFDPYGREIEDPKILQDNFTEGTNRIEPALQNKDDDIQNATAEMLNRSFADYKPQVTLSPRLQFSFPINDVSQVYAHYDVVVQRPKGTNNTGLTNINFFDPFNYYYWEQATGLRANPNLKPERLIDYEVGFQQVISEKTRSVVTLSAYYKERKDQIQARPYFYAYPQTYNAFGNRDFSTSKGLKVRFKTDIGNSSGILVNYMYSLTDGTGSSTTSQYSLIQSGQGNLRPTQFFLSNDVRHRIKANIYTRVNLADAASGFRKFANGFVFNLSGSIRSGKPYTRYARASTLGGTQNGDPILGTLNGARLPWFFNMDLKVSRDIVLRAAQAPGENSPGRTAQVINAFMYVQNVFNFKNLLAVYGYTGSPEDDGYLDSSFGQQVLQRIAETQRQSYIDEYYFFMTNSRFNTPRTINIGLSYNF